MTFDAVSGTYLGPAVSVDAKGTTIALSASGGDADGNVNLGGAVTILAGAGAGQVRRVVAVPDASHVTVDRPFATPLDATSRVSVGAYKGQIIFHKNDYKDCGAFQTYGTAQDVVVSEHTFERAEALSSWGRTLVRRSLFSPLPSESGRRSFWDRSTHLGREISRIAHRLSRNRSSSGSS